MIKSLLILILMLCSSFINDDPDRDKIIKILETYQKHYLTYLNTPFDVDSAKHCEVRHDLEFYDIEVYSRALPDMVRIICKNHDDELLELYIETMIISKGSANELPTYSLAELYICYTDKTVFQIEKNKERSYLLGSLDFGFRNVTNGKQDSIQNYGELESRLELLKRKYLH